MTNDERCPECGRALPADAREEVCPVCAFQGLLKFVTPGSQSEPPPADTDPPLTHNPQPTTRFGDYELVELLARGGMGVVYKARQTSLNRTVALKMIQAGLLATSAEIKRFHTEAEAIAQLQHPNIVTVYEIGEYDGQPYFSMDYVAGRTLAVRSCRSHLGLFGGAGAPQSAQSRPLDWLGRILAGREYTLGGELVRPGEALARARLGRDRCGGEPGNKERP